MEKWVLVRVIPCLHRIFYCKWFPFWSRNQLIIRIFTTCGGNLSNLSVWIVVWIVAETHINLVMVISKVHISGSTQIPNMSNIGTHIKSGFRGFVLIFLFDGQYQTWV